MNIRVSTAIICAASLLASCGKEPPPRSVTEYIESPILLEATMVRCAQDRSRTKYEAECVNAREAANHLAIKDEEARRLGLEAQSERKRKALRRTQEAAAEARRRADEAQRRREEAEYLGIYEVLPDEGVFENTDPAVSGADEGLQGNEPGIVVSPPEAEEEMDAPATDIDAVREELKKRQETSN